MENQITADAPREIAVDERFKDISYVFDDDDLSTTLWVVFMPEAVQNKNFKMYEVLGSMPGKKLYVSFRSRASFQIGGPEEHKKKVGAMADFINDFRSKLDIERTIGWGYSRGAYVCLLIGTMLKFDRLVALSPELRLCVPHSKSSRFVNNPFPEYADLLPLIEKFAGEKIDLLMPCFSPEEGFNLDLAEGIQNPVCRVIPFRGGHFIQRRFEASELFPSILSKVYRGEDITLPARWIATELDKRIAKASYQLHASIARKEYEVPDLRDRHSENYNWFILKGQALLAQEDYFGAIEAFERAVEVNAKVVRAWDNLAKAYLKINELDKAKQANARARALKNGEAAPQREAVAEAGADDEE